MGRAGTEPGLRAGIFVALLALGVAASCAGPSEVQPDVAGGGTTRPASAPAPKSPTYKSWQKVMADAVGPAFDFEVHEAAKPAAQMDLPAVAKFAAEAADALAIGRTRPGGRPDDPQFTTFATEAEAFFRAVEKAARQGDGAAAQQLVLAGEERHCNRCHDKYQ